MQLQEAVNNVFAQLAATLRQLSDQEYVQPCASLFKNTIGQHVRHIIELFQCLESGYEGGIVNYEKRKRDALIETDKKVAEKMLCQIFCQLNKPNKELSLEACYDDSVSGQLSIATNYYREVAYNLEHAIHHMALIRTGINEVSKISLPEEFGVAVSTIKYRKQCAQ
ncbi:MAG: DinB family protein [Bacteroidetes bacterium]|nr:DinB family protein [Bacteroidota bacterium]MBS1973754.1 DinB family protein [Bacteroidota bacterium]